MSSNYRAIRVLLLSVALLVPSAIAQETTAGVEGVVKDVSGAVILNATVKVSGPALQGVITVGTDAGGHFRVTNLPVGEYTLVVSVPGFRTFRRIGIELSAGRFPALQITMQLGVASEFVTVRGTPEVDVTQSKVQTNITDDYLRTVPRGTSFHASIQFAPGARTEVLQAGYQIDGASNSENSYLVEGQETADILTGSSRTQVPTEFIKEVQVKSSGFEAQYGGALGGVVNVIGRRGSNEWHGSVLLSLRNDRFDAAPSQTLRYVPNTSITQIKNNGAIVGTIDQPVEYFQAQQDSYSQFNPGLEAGGYVFKDRLWTFAGFVPAIRRQSRTVVFASPSPAPGPVKFPSETTTYFSYARVDFRLTEKVRLFGSWNYAYQNVAGNRLPGADSPWGQFNPDSVNPASNYDPRFGSTAPNVIYGAGADISLTPNLIATSRFGRLFTDYQDRGFPVGVKYWLRNSNYPYGTNVGGTRTVGGVVVPKTSLTGTPLPSAFALPGGASNMGPNTQTLFDKSTRTGLSEDIAYFHKMWGMHNLKAGYQMNRLSNDTFFGANTSQMYVAYGVALRPWTPAGASACVNISAQNQANYSTPGVSALDAKTGASCIGLWGTVNIREFSTIGKASSFNHALYIQDAWTIGHGVTLNVGMRFDKETVPSYEPELPSIHFGFGQKAAPRLGASWDVLSKGKVKIFGSYGWFYDIMKYQMPRGAFGGDYWHDCTYALDVYDYTTIMPVRGADRHYCGRTGDATFSDGHVPTGLRFIDNLQFRDYANDPNAFGSLGKTGLIDPNLKPMKQHDYIAGAEWAISPTLSFAGRYLRKRLDTTIEDAATITPLGEMYYFVNPGMGVNGQPIPPTECTGCPALPKAIRRYDALELRLSKRGSARWFGSLAYTYSRLEGNYSGLTSTDVLDGGGGRQAANVARNFDEPYMSFDAHGRVIDGPLGTDRPHAFKAFGYYRMKWRQFETFVGAFQQWYSGTPLSSYVDVYGSPVFVEGRGKMVQVVQDPATGLWTASGVKERRTRPFSQTDFTFVQQFHVSRTNEKLAVAFEVNILNLFNQHSPLVYGQSLNSPSTGGIYVGDPASVPASSASGVDWKTLLTGYDYIGPANDRAVALNRTYGLPTIFQTGRSMSFRLRFSF